VTTKIVLGLALFAFLAGPPLWRLSRNVRHAFRARVRIGQQSIVHREEGVRMRASSRAWFVRSLVWRTVDVVIGARDAYLFTRPLLFLPRPTYRLLRDGDDEHGGGPGVTLRVAHVEERADHVVVAATAWGGHERISLRLSSRAPAALARALRATHTSDRSAAR
jgi:hypothetical protein